MFYQLALVAKAPCFALVRVGKFSPMRIHTPGAQFIAYPILNMQALKITGITTKKISMNNENI